MNLGVVLGAILTVCLQASPASGASQLQSPASIKTEHEAIHQALVDATKVPGEVGQAARELADVLHPHFVREEMIALPPLGLLAPLASGETIPEAVLAEALKMSETLRKELPRMLEEHKAIRAAVQKLARVAGQEKKTEQEQFARDLALHAQTEEQVLYPAAVLVANLIRARAAD
jgi:iron-sulfur cluster repair protein YtfE (RIC family)